MSSKLQLGVVTTVRGGAISWTRTKAKGRRSVVCRLNCVIHVWAPWGRDSCHLRRSIYPRNFTLPIGPRIGSLNSPCRISYWSSIETIALNAFPATDRQTNRQTDRTTPTSRKVRRGLNPLMETGNYSATSNNMKSVHWPLMGGLLHLVQGEWHWAGRSPPRPLLAVPNVTATHQRPVYRSPYCSIMVCCSAVLMCPLKAE